MKKKKENVKEDNFKSVPTIHTEILVKATANANITLEELAMKDPEQAITIELIKKNVVGEKENLE